MENISIQKIALEIKLKQEADGLSLLKESLSKSEQLTFGMITILTSMESRLHKLEEAITPVHQETEHLTLLQENIEKASTMTDKLISIHQIPEEEENNVKRGPSDNIDSYLRSLEKLRKCVEFFMKSKPGSHDLEKCKSLFIEGADYLNREFRVILMHNCKPVAPAKLQEIINSHYDLDAISLSSHGSLNSLTSTNSIDAVPELAIEHICESALDKLRLIANWLSEVASNEGFVEAYSQVRSDIFERSLTVLKDHIHKATSVTITVSTVAGQNKKLNSLTIEAESKKKHKSSGKRKELKRMPSSAFIQSPAIRKNSTVLSSEGTGAGAEDSVNLEQAYIFPLLCIAFVKLSQTEMELTKSVLPNKYWSLAFSSLLKKALIFICGEGEKIVTSVRKVCISKNEYASILHTCPILRHFRNMASDYEAIFKALPNSARMKLKSLISSFKEAGGKGLEEFTASIKNDPDKQSNLPKDGTVHELTSNTIIFMEHLMEYSEIAGDMLNYQTTDSAAPLSQELGHGQCKTILGSYIARVLGALGLNLERKAKCYENVALQSIFLMNNYHHIIKSLERSGLIEWINALDGEITLEEHYKALIANQQHSYQKCWNKIIQNLIEENKSYHSGSDDSKMSRGSRQIIKDRFKAFNTGFEEVQRIQQHYSIPDEQLRNNIRKENIDTVVPLYEAFLQKHGNSQFTKNRDKYVKYSVQDLVNALSTFFDVSA